MDTRQLRWENAIAFLLAIEQSEHLAKEKAAEVAPLAKLKRQQDRAVRRLKGLVIFSTSSSDDDDDEHGVSLDDSDYPPQAADT
ncbi:hypothetical protein D1007_32895 [Hordeum vulgare]|nr:hypothetical protein D1007_32895 [Hordeum vulgare]